jgi:hypothetical protein
MTLHSMGRPGMDCKTDMTSTFTNRDQGGYRSVCLCRLVLEDWRDGCSHVLHTLTATRSIEASMYPSRLLRVLLQKADQSVECESLSAHNAHSVQINVRRVRYVHVTPLHRP